LRVNPADLRLGGEHVDVHAEDLLSRHADAHDRIAGAAPGFIGTSAAALTGLHAHWETESAGHYRELVAHGEQLRSAAGSYETSDTDAAAEINEGTSDLAGRMGI